MSKSANSANNPLGRYVLEVPTGVYPLNGDDPMLVLHSANTSSFNLNSRKESVYPDFNRWMYHVEQDKIMQNYLQKGYYEPPSVSNELLSARSVVHQLLHNEDKPTNPAVGPSQNNTVMNNAKLSSLSDTVVELINYRIKCNKALMKSTYKPPPRVTLTEHKKEMWLKNLANPDIPLSKLSRTIPHGIRNKVLLEQCCQKQIPIPRALWFVKCVGTNELRGLKRKNGPVMMTTASNHGKFFEQNWVHDWTVQVTEYVEKLTRDCFHSANHKQWRRNFDYVVKLSSHLFMSDLINKEVFLSWLVRFFKKICNDDRSEADTDYNTGDFKLISVHLIFLKLFWFKILKIDYLSKELSETMLLIYMKLQEAKLLTKELSLKLSKDFRFLIMYLFYYNSSSFIMSNHWATIKPVLKRIIDINDPVVTQQFELITYRNESLLMNLPDSVLNLPMECTLINKLDHFEETADCELLSYDIFEEAAEERNEQVVESSLGFKEYRHWKKNLEILLEWCLTRHRNNSAEQVYLTTSILKSYLRRCSLKEARSSWKKVKLDIESLLLEFIYSINDRYTMAVYSHSKTLPISIHKFLLLVNELYTMKLFTVSSYLRRIISSGIIYLPNAHSKSMLHILIIQNLPILHNAQCLSILKSLVGETNYQRKIELDLSKSKELLDICISYILGRNSANEVESNSEIWFHLQNMTHGVRLLASDYFLEQVKLGIEESNKVINLDRSRLSVAYKVFETLNQQSKFFQEFMILILSNDSRLVNIYLDSLYFICTIIMSNITLVQCLVPLTYDKQAFTSAFINILKLIITNYYTIRDTGSCDFTKFWTFAIDHLGSEKHVVLGELNTLISTKADSSNKATTRENVENCLKTIKLNVNHDQFLNSDRMRANELKLLEKYLAIVKMEMSGTEDIDLEVQDTLIQLLEILKTINEVEFVDHIVEFCNTSILPSIYLDFDAYLKFTMKLVVYELIDMNQLIDVFSKESSISDSITGNSNHRLIWHLLLDCKNDSGLSSYEWLKFNLLQKQFQNDHIGRLLDFIRIGITDSQLSFNITSPQDNPTSVIDNQFLVNSEDHLPTPISNNVVTPLPMIGGTTPLGNDTVVEKNPFISNFEEQLSVIFNKVAFTNVQLLLDKIVSKLHKNFILDIFNNLILLESKDIFSSKDLPKLVHVVNIFNLPLCQIILKSLWESELGPDKSDEFKSVAIQDHLMSLFLELVNFKKTNDEYKDLCFNQLFNLLDPKLELFVLDACKGFFLRSENFPEVYVTSEDESLIPNLNEIINNCSRAMSYYSDTTDTEDVIPLNDSLMFSLNSALEKLIYSTDKFRHSTSQNSNESCEYDGSIDFSQNGGDLPHLLESVNLFLKIVSIHKHFLVEKILKRTSDVSKDTFIQNLSRLYKSKVVRQESKLRNYFYDSLLSFELLFTETIEQHLSNKHDSTMSQLGPGVSQISSVTTNIFKLPPLNSENVLSSYLSKLKFKDGLVDYAPTKKLFLVNEKEDAYQEFSMRSFDLIEEANPVATLNNTSVSLQLFNATVETKNPP